MKKARILIKNKIYMKFFSPNFTKNREESIEEKSNNSKRMKKNGIANYLENNFDKQN